VAVPTRCILALSAALLARCGGSESSGHGAAGAPVRVLVEPLTFDNTFTRVEAVGTSRAIRSIELHAATSGEVDAIHFEPGQRVSQGDLLVELDKRDEVLAVQLARVRLEDADRLYERYQKSATSGAVLPTQLDAARTAAESARIELERARVALDYRTIHAPFSGFVDITEVDPGDRINPDTVITTLDDRSALLVNFDVPELLIGDLKPGDEVTLATWNDRGRTFKGKVVEIGSRIDPTTRTFVARATVDNGSDALRPGMSFRVSINVEGNRHPVVAETAVQWGADGAYLWTVDDGRAKRRLVRIVQRQQGKVLLDAEIEAGELVVVEGIQRMREGIAVSYDDSSMLGQNPANSGSFDATDAN